MDKRMPDRSQNECQQEFREWISGAGISLARHRAERRV